jgi:hypothetical protein
MKVLLLINDINHMSVASPPLSNDKFHEEHQGLFLFISPRTQEFIVLLWRHKLPIDPYSDDKHGRLNINSDQDHLDLVKLFLDTDLYWVIENNLEM